MSKSKLEQLEDAVKTVQALSNSSLLSGAECMLYFANVEKNDNGKLKITDEIVNDMEKALRNTLKFNPETTEEYIKALKTVRTICLESEEGVRYVNDQASKMAEIAATKNFFTDKYAVKKEDKDKGGCGIM